jgi:hypothetical protein
MATGIVNGPSGPVIVELTPEEEAQAVKDAEKSADGRAAKEAETLRVATYADDPEVTGGLTAIKGGTAPEIDAYVESVVTLTATEINALREEVQTALRGILRRQLKVQFNPTELLGQLDAAKTQATKIRK